MNTTLIHTHPKHWIHGYFVRNHSGLGPRRVVRRRGVKGRCLSEKPAKGAKLEAGQSPQVKILTNEEVVERLDLFPHWTRLPTRYKFLFGTFVSFVICNMDKVNMSVAIIPMAKEYGWSATVSGLVQSSFFYGYSLFQLPGGYLNTTFSGGRMLPIAVGLWSVATVGVPMLRGSVIGLCASRAIVGMGEALAPASLTDMVSSIVPVTERSRAMSFAGSALYLGSIIGLLLSPICVEGFGWPSVFYIFGGVGLLWTAWWLWLVKDVSQIDPVTVSHLFGKKKKAKQQRSIPWRGIFRSKPVYALIYTHFCNNWFHFALMAWLPSYFTDTMNLDLTQAAQISLLPPIAGILASLVAGPIADYLIAHGWKVGVVRKLAQAISFLGSSLFLLLASYPPFSSVRVFFITMALGITGFSLAGLYCNHQDLSPTYSSVLLGITNTAGALPGILGVAATGALLDRTQQSWPLALFAPSIFFFLTGSLIFTTFGSGEEASFADNTPLPIEKFFNRNLSTNQNS